MPKAMLLQCNTAPFSQHTLRFQTAIYNKILIYSNLTKMPFFSVFPLRTRFHEEHRYSGSVKINEFSYFKRKTMPQSNTLFLRQTTHSFVIFSALPQHHPLQINRQHKPKRMKTPP